MSERAPLPSPHGMDRNSPAYRAAVRAAVAGCPPLDTAQRVTLRDVFAGGVVVPERRVAAA